jgi:cytochrome P450 family 142 subfamily A polypeptide 1
VVIEDLNLLDGRWYADDPHAIWDEFRRSAPVSYDPVGQVWGIFKHADVLAIEKDPKTFSSQRAPRPHGVHLPMMISMDDPEHQRRRSLVSRGFTPRRVADLEPMVRRLTRQILDDVCARESCDFVWDVAALLPLYVIADLLGYEPDMYDDLLRWSEGMMSPNAEDMLTPEQIAERIEKSSTTMDEFRAAQLEIIADRRKRPRGDVMTIFCQAEIDGERLDDESIVQEMLLILIGGDETSRHVLSGGMLELLHEPEQMALMRRRDVDLALAADEMIRWASPVQNMARTATRDVEVRGQQVHEGDQLMLFYPSANRDEEVFDDAHRFDVRRNPNPHVAFGFGTHFCLGASLARLEVRVMFEELLPRMADIELAAPEPLRRRSSNFVSGLETLPITYTPSPGAGQPR